MFISSQIFFQKDIVLLALCWALTLTSSTLLTTIGPLSAKSLGVSDDFSAFTIGIFLFGAAISSYPSGTMFKRLGRFGGFALGCLAQIIGSLTGYIALVLSNDILLYFGCFCIGLSQGIGQFYRFGAVEVALQEYKSEAITLVLTGGVLSAFLGPTIATSSKSLLEEEYSGSFIMMSIIGILNFFDSNII